MSAWRSAIATGSFGLDTRRFTWRRPTRMDLAAVACIAVSVLVAAFVQATSGLGFALVVAPIFGLLAPGLLPVCVLVLMLPLSAYVAWRERAAVDRAGASWITAGRLAGTFGGLWVLTALSLRDLNLLTGALTIVAAVTTLVLPAFRARRGAFVAAGVVTGVTETATGIGGPPLALVYQHHAPAVLRSTIAVCFLLGQLISLALLGIAGRIDARHLVAALLLLPAVAAGAYLSRHVHHRVSQRGLRTFVLAFAIVSGVALLLRA